MVNVQKLKGKIVERGFSMSAFAEAIGVYVSTLYRRFSDDGKSFTIGEIERIAEVLELSSAEIHDIFFVQKVA